MPGVAPDAELRRAAALVFVEDLDAPLLGDEDAHHLGEVLRLRPGEAVAASDGAGSWRMCAFVTLGLGKRRAAPGGSPSCALEVAGPLQRTSRPLPVIGVGFSWAKAERTEWAVAKLVELGVDVITPLVADRTVVRPDAKAAGRRSERLRRIVREAAMQSRRPMLPELAESQSVDEFVGRVGGAGVALAEPGGAPLTLVTPAVLVGPEGGWSSRELALVEEKVGLGDGVLRVETAALVAGALLSSLRGTALLSPP